MAMGTDTGTGKRRGRPKGLKNGAGKGTGTGTDIKKDTGTGAGAGTGTGQKKRGRKKGQKSTYTVSEKALAQRRQNGTVSPMFEGDDINYNARLIQHIMEINKIAANCNPKDPESIRVAFVNYLMLCQQDGFRISNLGAYAAIGVNKNTIETWARGSKEEFRQLAEAIRTTCSLARESMISEGKINPVIGIFWQRNFDGLRNDTEQIQSVEVNNHNDSNEYSELKRKYGELIEE